MAKRKNNSKKTNGLASLWSFIAWLTGVLVSLAVGFGMIGSVLTVPYIPNVISVTAGWIVVILTILGVLLALIDKMSR